MDGYTPNNAHLASKIARLVEEKGWNQEDFARIANLNRHTASKIMNRGDAHRLRNATIGQCALAFGLQVNELRQLPLEALLQRLSGSPEPTPPDAAKPVPNVTHPDLQQWLDRYPDRVAQLTPEEMSELLAQQGANGAFLHIGVDQFVQLLERKRKLLMQVRAIAATPHLALLEQIVELIFEKSGRNS